ncbi:MAG: transglutaminase family protein [Burkholderiales bacterium]|nr:transglutaminase family protein [Burkholderiales bacterium]
MTIRVALHHQTRYRFDRPVALAPHEIRLRPAVHCRTPIHSYSLTVVPENHFINWQQDAYGNYLARLVFPEKTRELMVTVDLVADLTVINPFDFFVEQYAEKYPFRYPDQLAIELAPYLEREPAGPLLQAWLDRFRREGFKPGMNISDFLVNVNAMLQGQIAYLVRMEPGVQACDETLAKQSGSCRDSGWLLVQILRHLGLAARFVSGYLIQLTADVKPLEGPAGTSVDFTDLHAWAEVYIPGAGWIGLDPTSGLFAGEGHIPLACTAFPSSAAPVTGATDVCETTLEFAMSVTRIHEDPRVTKPYTEEQWSAIEAIGHKVDAELVAADVRLTQGGEPTFVSIDDMDGPEWNYTALSEKKWALAQALAQRLFRSFAPGGLLQYGQGKWYPGEPLPRWALGILWRPDGKPLWRNPALMATSAPADADGKKATEQHAREFGAKLAAALGLDANCLIPAYEDVWLAVKDEQELPVNVDPLNVDLASADERAWLARSLNRGLGAVTGYVLPLKAAHAEGRRGDTSAWESSVWPLKREHLYLLPGDSPLGYRLPLASLPKVLPRDTEPQFQADPFEARQSLHDAHVATEKIRHHAWAKPKPKEVVRTALCLQVQEGVLSVFLPPVPRLEDFVNLVAAVEDTAAALALPVRIGGYAPPFDPRLRVLNVTPDPGVIEVNIHPARTWQELVVNTTALYEDARQARLGTEKFMLDGRHTGTGGGNHVTLGGATPADSPMLRRPDLLQSLITYWQNHPALSYLFSGQFIGPTSQAPRVDEARDANLYELEIAFQQIETHLPKRAEGERPWLIDRLLRHLLTDLTGNTHRAEFSIDKLYSPDSPTGRLGLVEFRAFEMPPHARMSLTQVLLLRALVARFWKEPYRGRLVHWGTQLHDRWMLPHFIAQDMADVVRDLDAAGYAFRLEWFAPFLEFRFPRYGTVAYEGVQVELRQAIEPWIVLGEEMQAGAASRYVDSSVERLQVKVNGMTDSRHVVTCNGRPLPLHPTGTQGEFVAGVRYRAWAPPSALHPTIGVHSPLVFDIVDTWGGSGKSIGGCTYHVVHPGGRNYDTFPVNANEAEARRFARFWDHGHTPGAMRVVAEPLNRNFPFTLDLRRRSD